MCLEQNNFNSQQVGRHFNLSPYPLIHFSNNLDGIPTEYNLRSESPKMAVIDYISGMTDRYAIRLSERLYPGIASIFLKRLV